MIETSLQHDEPVAMPARSFGKQARSMAGYVLLTALMFVSPLFVFIPASLLHCGIRMGRRAAWLLLILSSVIAALLIYPAAAASTAAEAQTSYAYLLGLFLAIALPGLVVLPMVERGEKFGRVLLYALVLSIAGLGVTELTMRMAAHGFSPYAAQVAEAHTQISTMVAAFVKAGVPEDRFAFLSKWTAMCVPTILLVNVTIVFVFSLEMF